MYKKTNPVFLACLFVFSAITVFGQDNPASDRLPEVLRHYKYKATPPPPAVITVNDYDNFHIGTDMAETHLVINPSNPLQQYAAWNSAGNNGGIGYKTDDGFTWTIANPSWGSNNYGDIVLAYDSVGHLYYENMYGSASIQGCEVAVSVTNGSTWPVMAPAIAGSDKNWMAADQTAGPYANYVYSTMTGSGGNGNFARTTDFGSTWQNTATFSPQSLPGMMVCVGPNDTIQGGSVHVVTNSGSNTASTYTFYHSTDGGLTFQMKSAQNFANYVGNYVNSRHSVENMRTRPYPFIAADNSFGPFRGRLYVVYASNSPAGLGFKPDIFCRFSDDKGATWSPAVTVNDDVNPQNNHSWLPAIWCDKETGRLYIQWMDSRDTPTSDSAMIYASYSDTGGLSFAPNQAVSNAKMKINCTSCPASGTPRYQGDYNGVASNAMGAVLSWTDFRTGSFANYIGYFPDFGLRLTPAIDTLYDSAWYVAVIPSVKLYTDTVFFEATSNAPANTLDITFPMGNKTWTYPGSTPIKVTQLAPLTPGDYTLTLTAHGSLGTPVHKRTAVIRVPDTTVSIPETLHENLLSVFPNPAGSVLNITSTFDMRSPQSLFIYNTMGEMVMQKPQVSLRKDSRITLDISSLAEGTYVLVVGNDRVTFVKQ